MKPIIYKYLIEVKDIQTIHIPMFANILTVQSQKDNIFLWAMCDKDETRMVDVTIEVIATGDVGMDGVERKYLGTVQLYDGNLVFHVFQRV